MFVTQKKNKMRGIKSYPPDATIKNPYKDLKHIQTLVTGELKEQVDHPSHYNNSDVEVFDMMISIWGEEEVAVFCKMNAFKYRMRAGLKGDATEDIKKAKWYEDKFNQLSAVDKV